MQSIPYWMPAHVCACATSTGMVLLDLKRNRYFGIGRDETRALVTVAANLPAANTQPLSDLEPMAADDATRIADRLAQAGLLTRDAPHETVITAGTIDLGGMLTSVGHELVRDSPLRFAHILQFLRACAWARRALRSPLYSVVREISGSKAAAAGDFDEQRAIELACIFRRLRPYAFATKDQCLFHALALVRFLSRHGVFPMWVIGVRVRPWAAHSWVQQGNLIFDCSPEQVCEYTPILAV